MIDQAVVIRHWDFSETSQTVSLFTREHGVIRGLAKGARREKGNFSGGLELLTRGQIVAMVKPTRDLATLTEWDLQEVFWACRRELRAHRIGLYMIELVHLAITDQDPHEGVFDVLVDSLRGLATASAQAKHLLLFQWRLLCDAGYRPMLELDGRSGGGQGEATTFGFSVDAGGLVPDPGQGGQTAGRRRPVWRVRRETVDLLRSLDDADPGPDPGKVTGREAIERGSRLLSLYLREVLGREIRTRALAFE